MIKDVTWLSSVVARCSFICGVIMLNNFFSKTGREGEPMSAGLAKQLATVGPKTLVYCCVVRMGMDSSWETEVRNLVVRMTVSPL